MLRPTLGHPNNKPELKNLKSLEQSRQQENDKALEDYERLMRESENIHLKKFLEELVKLVSLLMTQFDLTLIVDDVIEGGKQQIFDGISNTKIRMHSYGPKKKSFLIVYNYWLNTIIGC